MHGGQKRDGRHSGGTDLDDDVGDVGQYRMGDVADETTRVAPINRAQKKRTARRWFLWVISVWVVIVLSFGP